MSSVKVELRKDQVEKIHSFCDEFNNEHGELINVLHKTQGEFGYLPAEVQEVIADPLIEKKLLYFKPDYYNYICAWK